MNYSLKKASSEGEKKEDGLFFTTFHLHIFKGGNIMLGLSFSVFM